MIIADELKLYLSGGTLNTDPNLSLGGQISTTQIAENLFNAVINTDITSYYEDYRCIYLYNSSNTESIINLRILTAVDNSGDDSDLFLSLAHEGINNEVQSITSSTTAPLEQTFLPCLNDSTALSIGNLGPNQFVGIWFKRTVNENPNLKSSCTVNFFIKADTP